MYRMLIVDDEPIMVEGLYTLFQEIGHLDLELHKAYSAADALQCLERHRMDIVLSDIEMPKCNGLKMHQQIQKNWPRCKVIFLTGYSHAEYIHQSIRQGAVDYVLKTEGDEAILSAVEKAYHQLAREFNYEVLARKSKDQMKHALPSLQKDYWIDLLKGESTEIDSRAKRFERLNVLLSADQDVLLLIGRIDEWREHLESSDKALLQYSVQNIAEEFLNPLIKSEHVLYDRERIIWFMQPQGETDPSGAHRYVQGQLERIQDACKSYLKISCSFALASRFSKWEEVAETFDRLQFTLLQGFGMEKEMILSDKVVKPEEHLPIDCRRRLKKLQTLAFELEKGEEEAFFNTLDEIFSGEYVSQQGYALEIYYSVLSMFISYMNRNRLIFEISEQFNLGKWFHAEDLKSWQEMKCEFGELAKLCFQKNKTEHQHRTHEVVEVVKDYIEQNLKGDLSLTHLAELVYLTPAYLSRLFRLNNEQSITDYITEKRVDKAKVMLTQSNEKIHRIGISIGFESPPYFTKFMKKHLGMTPQEFRDAFSR